MELTYNAAFEAALAQYKIDGDRDAYLKAMLPVARHIIFLKLDEDNIYNEFFDAFELLCTLEETLTFYSCIISDEELWSKVETFAVGAMLTGLEGETTSTLMFAKALGKQHSKLLADIKRDFAPAGLFDPYTQKFTGGIIREESASGKIKELLLPPDAVMFLMLMQAQSYRRYLAIKRSFTAAKEKLTDDEYSELKFEVKALKDRPDV